MISLDDGEADRIVQTVPCFIALLRLGPTARKAIHVVKTGVGRSKIIEVRASWKGSFPCSASLAGNAPNLGAIEGGTDRTMARGAQTK